MVSPRVFKITPNRNLNTPKVTKITFVELEIAILPSLPPVTPLKYRCTGRLRHGRDICFPSRLRTPVNKGAPSEKGRKGG